MEAIVAEKEKFERLASRASGLKSEMDAVKRALEGMKRVNR